ncbi:lytic transglycosylase domain-containing protein [Notoacmeibacter marinus]|uniref:lytic transglycosylase domain-containing protein n=1 Tax=Notoacmeibacter marinus TaxID=1876515 RepID=UPI001FE1AD87|nr:lytic transglycosylase domain-containing protein [Notoacmeibacter marinus]
MLRHRSATGWHRAIRTVALFLLSGLLSTSVLPTIAPAQDAPVAQESTGPYARHIAEASQRFRIPERWIRAVMQVESAGRVRAVSNAGAMGLMQIMPATWAELRIRHRLGRDPFDPRDNILGGTAYLREMYDRFGSPGFLAAYNAGPERYQQHLDTGRTLPRETRVYMATLIPMLGLDAPANAATSVPAPPDWREAPLFVERSERTSDADRTHEKRQSANDPESHSVQHDWAQDVQPEALFVAQSRVDQ